MTEVAPHHHGDDGHETVHGRLERLSDRFRLTKTTKRLIAEAIDSKFAPGERPGEATMRQVCEGIEVFVLAGLDSDQLIQRAIKEAKTGGEPGEDWRLRLWRDLLAAANDEYKRLGCPEDVLGSVLQALPPIPPQPAEELDDSEHPLAA